MAKHQKLTRILLIATRLLHKTERSEKIQDLKFHVLVIFVHIQMRRQVETGRHERSQSQHVVQSFLKSRKWEHYWGTCGLVSPPSTPSWHYYCPIYFQFFQLHTSVFEISNHWAELRGSLWDTLNYCTVCLKSKSFILSYRAFAWYSITGPDIYYFSSQSILLIFILW